MLTASTIKHLKPRGTPYRVADTGHEVSDGICKGLAVHVSAKGHKSFVLAKKIDGKRRFFKLGDVSSITLAEARSAGKTLKQELSRGLLPNQRTAEEKIGTVNDLYLGYIEYLSLKNTKTIESIKYTLSKDGIATIKNRKANEVSSEEFADIIRKVVQRGSLTQATHTRSALHAMYTWGIGADLDTTLDSNGAHFKIKNNPITPIPKPRKGSNALSRFLSENEIREVWEELNNRSPIMNAALKMQLCTGQRVREVLGMKWTDIEQVNGEYVWFIKDTKNGRPHSVVLNELSLTILQQLKRHTGNCLVCFPKRNTTTIPMSNNSLSQLTIKVSKKLKIDRFSPRDLRRTFKTIAIKNGLPKSELDIVQNHAINDVSSKHYDKYDYLKEKGIIMHRWCHVLNKVILKPTEEESRAISNNTYDLVTHSEFEENHQ